LPPNRWQFPWPGDAPADDLVVTGGDLEPQTLMTAYGMGLFPMPVRRRALGWWSPDPRGVLPLDGLRVSRSLRRSCRRYEVRIDTAFRAVVEACATIPRPHGWLNAAFVDAYERLFRLGHAHSVETWSTDGQLVGGLYGVALGGLFAGESMFHQALDASKVALVALADRLAPVPDAVLDVQWSTPHLKSLGVVDLDRNEYLGRVGRAISAGDPWANDQP
jgi:leucyl/phenylalanyl-tRNA--protein transferase